MARSTALPKSDNINIRVSPDMLGLIDRAATVYGKSRTEFILDTMRKAAEDAVLDQRLFVLNAEQWEVFTAMLDAPTRENPRLNELLARKPVWED
jgi:uncharacterized protein (DUF1778 family)